MGTASYVSNLAGIGKVIFSDPYYFLLLGGGSLFVSILLLLLNFSITQSTAISSALIFFTLIFQQGVNYKINHPVIDKPSINFEIAMFFVPSSILGTVFGVTLLQLIIN
jgi:uncharacterized membrane protein YfcA